MCGEHCICLCLTEPVLVASPNNVTTLISGTPVEMQCRVDGYPRPKITWQHQDVLVDKWDNLSRYQTERHQYHKGGRKLEFLTLWRSDIGYYRCRADNKYGVAFSEPAYLNIQGDHSVSVSHFSRFTVCWFALLDF
jgi:hypothetical protein